MVWFQLSLYKINMISMHLLIKTCKCLVNISLASRWHYGMSDVFMTPIEIEEYHFETWTIIQLLIDMASLAANNLQAGGNGNNIAGVCEQKMNSIMYTVHKKLAMTLI